MYPLLLAIDWVSVMEKAALTGIIVGVILLVALYKRTYAQRKVAASRLVRTDVILMISVIVLFFMRSERWMSVFQGFAAALFFLSILGHIEHYRQTKKFY